MFQNTNFHSMLYIGIVLKYLRHNIFLTFMSKCFIKVAFLFRLKVSSEDVARQHKSGLLKTTKALYCFRFYVYFITTSHVIRAFISNEIWHDKLWIKTLKLHLNLNWERYEVIGSFLFNSALLIYVKWKRESWQVFLIAFGL